MVSGLKASTTASSKQYDGASLYNALKSRISNTPDPISAAGATDKGLLGSIQGSFILKLVKIVEDDAPNFGTWDFVADVGSGDGCLSLYLSTRFGGALMSLGVERQASASRVAFDIQIALSTSAEEQMRIMAQRTHFIHSDIFHVFTPWYKYIAVLWWYALGWGPDSLNKFHTYLEQVSSLMFQLFYCCSFIYDDKKCMFG